METKTSRGFYRELAPFSDQDLRNKAEVAYKDMEDWLGARFLKEMESIDAMSQLMRNAVEAKHPLADEIEIFQEDFLIRAARRVVRYFSSSRASSRRVAGS